MIDITKIRSAHEYYKDNTKGFSTKLGARVNITNEQLLDLQARYGKDHFLWDNESRVVYYLYDDLRYYKG